MSIHDEIQELIPSYVIGALEPDEAARVEEHTNACDRCTLALAEYQSVAGALAYTAPMAEPPGSLKARALEHATASHKILQGARPRIATRAPIRRTRDNWWQRLGFTPLLAGVATALIIGLLAWNVWQINQLNRQFEAQRNLTTLIAYENGSVVTVRGTNGSAESIGKLYVDPDSNVAALVTVKMPPLGAGQVYQVWLTQKDGHLVSGGTFTLDDDGDGWLLVRAAQRLDAYTHVAISPEPRGGSLRMTGTPLLEAALTLP